ncbi:hypothetical protein DWG18_07500 [Lysobacter sp. TY2-98]|uniref:hypothetical protein n=1 Tax=Lysobacter sp. TY2-98 TaxID=2290922 RepID=UPI000E209E1A|nr:hypothetical protein [Lysobacter sp. TY2-98]AXK72142.1 hypothetical protein DWG18_07500 [Lysobacter sp. TY2-98]
MVDADFTARRERIVRDVLAYQPLPTALVRRRRWIRCGAQVLALGGVCGALVAVCLAHPDHVADVTIGVLIAIFMLGTAALAGATRTRLERDLARIPPIQFDEVMRLCRAHAPIGAAVRGWREALGELRNIEGRMLCAASDELTLLGVERELAGGSSDVHAYRTR